MSYFTENLKLNNFQQITPNSITGGNGQKLKARRFYKRPKFIIPLAVIIVLALGYWLVQSRQKTEEPEAEKAPVEVKALAIDTSAGAKETIDAIGIVKAGTEVEVVALSRGTISGIFFNVGDKVGPSKLLASMQNEATAVNYSNARVNLSNARLSYETSKLVSAKSVEQAQLAAENAEESVKAAEIGVKTAQDNLNNIKSIQEKSNSDVKDLAIVAYYNSLNTINSTLDQVNFLIQADKNVRDQQLENILGVKNLAVLSAARTNYILARQAYGSLRQLSPARETIENDFGRLIAGMESTKQSVDNTIDVLNNSITSAIYNEAWLNGQKVSFSALQSSFVGSLNQAKQTFQGLENLDLVNQQERDQLKNALKAAESRLASAQLAYQNSLVGLEAAKNGQTQQLNAARTSVDSAQGQANLFATQLADLSVKSPITGVITAKYVDLGAEISSGQKIAKVSNVDLAKIEVSLPSEQAYRIRLGKEAIIQDEFKGIVSLIDPAADPLTKKVGVEIVYNNSRRDLILESFVDIELPATQPVKSRPNSFFIPLKAVTITQTENYVFTAVAGQATSTLEAKLQPVAIGRAEGELIEILGGLADGDRLIIENNKILENGDIIIVKD